MTDGGTRTLDTFDPEPGEQSPAVLDDAQRARAIHVGNVVQATVSARPDIAVSVIGMGLDALSSALIHNPDAILDMAPWVNLAADVFGYVSDGRTTPELDALFAGNLGI